MTRKTIRLVVTMPDPGEWCFSIDLEPTGHRCPMFDTWTYTCDAGHFKRIKAVEDACNVRRPQSCRDAEVRE